jgi:ferredoxin
MVADVFEKAFTEKGIEVLKFSVTGKEIPQEDKDDMLLVVYAVHACNAPEPVYRWIKSLSAEVRGRAAVISVSGGGEVSPNTACRVNCIKKLRKKGYDVIYDKMLVMPSNWIVETKEPLAVKLLEVLPERVDRIINDLIAGTRRSSRPALIDRLFSKLGEIEKQGTGSFGKKLKCGDSCTSCGWCSSHCPAGNITIENGRAVFGAKCNLCLSCIYGCPKKAISPGIANFIVIKQGFNLKELEQKVPYPEPVDVEKLAKGFVWSGVKKYLLEEK